MDGQVAAKNDGPELHTLAIDIGGSFIKAAVLDEQDRIVGSRVREPTPQPATPDAVLGMLAAMVAKLPPFDRISAGFPGVVRGNVTYTAPNLGTPHWAGFRIGDALRERFGKPARVANDADVQGLGVIEGKGLELVVTLGTGFGSAFFLDGRLLPHLELGQHPVHDGKTYDQFLGAAALKAKGRKRWNKHLGETIKILATLANYDMLLIGGGNAEKVDIPLPPNVKLVSNTAGITGGIHLWDPALDSMFPENAKAEAVRPAAAAQPPGG